MEDARACILENNKNLHPFDTILATVTIARDHHEELEAIQQASDDSEIIITRALAENVRIIVSVLGSSPQQYDKASDFEAFKKHIFKLNRDQSNTKAGTSENYQSSESATKCYRFIFSFQHADNGKFFERLANGLHLVNELTRDDGEGEENDNRKNKLRQIIEKIPKCKLDTPESDKARESFDRYVKLLNESDEWDDSRQVCSTYDVKSFFFGFQRL